MAAVMDGATGTVTAADGMTETATAGKMAMAVNGVIVLRAMDGFVVNAQASVPYGFAGFVAAAIVVVDAAMT